MAESPSRLCTSRADGSPSLQELACTALHRAIGLKTVLPLLGWARQYPALLYSTKMLCKRFIIRTFDACVDLNGAEAVADALDDSDLFTELLAESEERQHALRALRTKGRILERQPTALEQKSDPALSAALIRRLNRIAAAKEWGEKSSSENSGSGVHGSGARRDSGGSDVSLDGAPGTPPNTEAAVAEGSPSQPGSPAPSSGGGAAAAAQAAEADNHQGRRGEHPYGSLIAGVRWPDDVNIANRELHLAEAEFAAVFGMARCRYEGLPAWKRVQLKKQHKLF